MSRESELTWSDLFSRSSVGGPVFAIRRSARRELGREIRGVLDDLAVPTDVRVKLFDNRVEAWPFLDGGVVTVDPPYFRGLRGAWLIGTDALRLFCHRIGAAQPRRLAGESVVCDVDDLEGRLDRQKSDPAELRRRLEALLGVKDGETLRRVADELARLE